MIFLFVIYCITLSLPNIAASEGGLSLSDELERLKLRTVSVTNTSYDSASLVVSYFYQPDFDEEDFALNIARTILFPSSYKVIPPRNGKIVDADQREFSCVCVLPCRDCVDSTAIILQRSIEVPPEGIMIPGFEGAYIGRITSENSCNFVSYLNTASTHFSLVVGPAELFSKTISSRSLSIMAGVAHPFFEYFKVMGLSHHLFNTVTKDVVQRKLFEKFQAIHDAGLQYNQAISEHPYITKTPFILHSFIIGNSGSALQNEIQRTNLIESTRALLNSGWQQFIWTDNDADAIRSALGDVADKVEIKGIFPDFLNIQGTRPTDVVNIQDFIGRGKQANATGKPDTANAFFNAATALLKYKVLLEYGGVIRSSNAKIVKNLLPLHNFGFYASLDSGFPLLSTELFAACPNHPIIKRALEISVYHHNSDPKSIHYLRNLRKFFLREHYVAEHYVKYESALTLAFYQNAELRRDMLFDSSILSQDSIRPLTSQTYVLTSKS